LRYIRRDRGHPRAFRLLSSLKHVNRVFHLAALAGDHA